MQMHSPLWISSIFRILCISFSSIRRFHIPFLRPVHSLFIFNHSICSRSNGRLVWMEKIYSSVCVCVSRWFRTVNLWVDLLYRLKIQVIWKDSIPNHHTIFQHSLSISHVVSLTHTHPCILENIRIRTSNTVLHKYLLNESFHTTKTFRLQEQRTVAIGYI